MNKQVITHRRHLVITIPIKAAMLSTIGMVLIIEIHLHHQHPTIDTMTFLKGDYIEGDPLEEGIGGEVFLDSLHRGMTNNITSSLGNGGIGRNLIRPLTPPPPQTANRRKKRGCRGGRQKRKERQLELGIFNLAEEVFTEEEWLTLQDGLKFAPSRFLNKFSTMIDIITFSRKLNIEHFFRC